MSLVLRQAGASEPVPLPRWKGSSRAESGQARKRQAFLIGWLASLLGGISPLAVPPALLAGALSLFASAPAGAQTTVWSATLTADIAYGNFYGCDNSDSSQDNCSTATVLTDDDFTYQGRTHTVRNFYWHDGPTPSLVLGLTGLSGAAAKRELSGLTLNVQGNAFAISDAEAQTNTVQWTYSPATAWTDGLKVSVSLTDRRPTLVPGHGHLKASWTTPGDSYELQYKETGAPDRASLTGADPALGWVNHLRLGRGGLVLDIKGTSRTITGLKRGTSYDVRLRATTGGTVDLWSAVARARTLGTKPAPAKPTAPTRPPSRRMELANEQTLLSATLTVDETASSDIDYFGCDNSDPSHDNCSAALTNDSFTHMGVASRVTKSYTRISQVHGIFELHLALDSEILKDHARRLTLHLDGKSFPFTGGQYSSAEKKWTWTNHGLTWTAGQQVQVRLTAREWTGVKFESAGFVPSAEWWVHDLLVPEGGSETFGIRLTKQPTANVTVNLWKNTSPEMPHGDVNAATVSPKTLTFTSSNWSQAQTVTVTGVQDSVDDHEHLWILAQVSSADTDYSSPDFHESVFVTVSDDGGAAQVGAWPAIGREAGNGQTSNVPVTVWLSRPSTASVSVSYGTANGTATAGSDYTAVNGTLTFAPGETRKTVQVPILDDNVKDSGDTFYVVLSNPTGASLEPDYTRAVVQILNDEAHLDGLTVEGAASIDGPFTALDLGAFAAETMAYAVTAPHRTTHVRLVPTTADEDLTLSAGSGTELTQVRSGESGPAVALEVGENVLVVKVVAGTGVEKTYRVTVTRQQSTGTTTTDTPTTSSSGGPSPAGSGPDGETLLVAFGEIAQTPPEVSIEIDPDGSSPITEGEEARFMLRATPRPSAPITVAVTVTDSGDFVSSGQPNPRMVVIGEDGTGDFSVATQDDDRDEPNGTITVTVAAGPGYDLSASDNTAEVEVRDNDDPAVASPREEKRSWQIRFGRSVSQQVVDALQQRFSSSTPSGLQLTVAGETVTSDTPLEENHVLLSRLLGFESVSSQEMAQGSSFSFSPEGASSHRALSFWGKGALSSFNGIEESITLTGEVTTALLGAEWSHERWRAGAALSHSWGSGSYQGEGDGADGRISSSLTGIFPYGRYALTPRLGIWATAGYGWGNLTLNPDGDGPEYNPATTLALGAVGMDGLLLDGGSEGVTLTTTADALFLKTSSEAVVGLASSEGNISRLRLGLEASRAFPLANGASLSPSLEVGLRQDSGDAETGFGMDLGAGLSWSAPQHGITAEVKGRTLLSHGAEDFQDQGLALSFSWQPSPSNRGASLSLSHAVGLPAEGGLAALLNPTAIEVLDDANSDGERFEARLAYGFPFYNNRLTLTPAVATALSTNSRTYGLLWSVAPYDEHLMGEPWQLSLEGERQENLSSPTVDHSLKLRFALPL